MVFLAERRRAEFVGILTEHRGKQAVILGVMIAVYTILALIAYRN